MVSRDIIHIGFLLASIHGVNITAINLENEYLNSPCAEKISFIGDNKCAEDKGCVIPFVHNFYGLKYAGFLLRSALAVAFQEIGLKPMVVDPNVWIRATTSPDVYEYYEMLPVYVDDIMIFLILVMRYQNRLATFIRSKKGVKVHLHVTQGETWRTFRLRMGRICVQLHQGPTSLNILKVLKACLLRTVIVRFSSLMPGIHLPQLTSQIYTSQRNWVLICCIGTYRL